MPGYNLRPNPFTKAGLPDGIGKVIETVFPSDDPLGGLGPIASVKGPVYKAVKGVPPAISLIVKMLRGKIDDTDPLKILAAEKINSRVPASTALRLPEGLKLPDGPSDFPRRSPLINELYARQRVFDASQPTLRSSSTRLKATPAPPTSVEDILAHLRPETSSKPVISGRFMSGNVNAGRKKYAVPRLPKVGPNNP